MINLLKLYDIFSIRLKKKSLKISIAIITMLFFTFSIQTKFKVGEGLEAKLLVIYKDIVLPEIITKKLNWNYWLIRLKPQKYYFQKVLTQLLAFKGIQNLYYNRFKGFTRNVFLD